MSLAQDITKWLNDVFVEKDKLLAYHAKHNVYDAEEIVRERTMFPLYMSIFWFAVHIVVWAWFVHRCVCVYLICSIHCMWVCVVYVVCSIHLWVGVLV